MNKVVIELQKDILNNSIDIVSILRKAHLIASKLNLSEFNKWIINELNGYEDYSSIPDYRSVVGEIKAKNPYYGLVPIMLPSNMASELNVRKIFNPMSEIVALVQDNKSITMSLPTEISEMLCASSGITLPCYYIFGSHYLTGIIESVKNTLLEWCIKLEKDGIMGDEFEFTNQEIEKAKGIPQQINYYGQVINGNVNNSQVINGNTNSVDFKLNEFSAIVDEIKKSICREQLNDDRKNEVFEFLEDIDCSIKQKKKPSIIKSALIGLKDFLINVGASITASIITDKISNL